MKGNGFLDTTRSKNRISIRDHIVFISVTFVYWFSMYIYVPVLPTYLESLGATYTFIGIVLGSYGVMQVLIRLPIGIFSDLMKARRPFIILGLVTSVLSCVGFVLSDGLGWALGFRTLSGVAASTWVTFTVLYSNFFSKEGSTQSMSIMQFVTVTAQVISMGVSGVLVKRWGLEFPFLIGGILGFIGLTLSFFIKEPVGDDAKSSMHMKDVPAVMRNPLLVKVSLLSVFAHCVLFITVFGYTAPYALNLGVEEGELGYISFAFLIPHAIASLFSGRKIAPVLGQWMTLTIGFLGSAVFTCMIPLVDHYGWLCLTQSFNGFFLGLTFPLLLSMAIQSVPREKQATAMGFYQSVFAVGIFLGPFLAGLLNHMFGLKGGFFLAATLGFIAVGISYVERNNFKYSVDNDVKA